MSDKQHGILIGLLKNIVKPAQKQFDRMLEYQSKFHWSEIDGFSGKIHNETGDNTVDYFFTDSENMTDNRALPKDRLICVMYIGGWEAPCEYQFEVGDAAEKLFYFEIDAHVEKRRAARV